MPKLITFSSFMLFWVFYELSGGSDFQPKERKIVSQAPFVQTNESRMTYHRPVTTAPVVTATYVPVSTEPLTAELVTSATSQDVPVIAPIPIEEPEIQIPAVDLRYVDADRVNLRRGPGTNHQVVDTLDRGTQIEVIAMNEQGWAQIRLTESGQSGWMAARLISVN